MTIKDLYWSPTSHLSDGAMVAILYQRYGIGLGDLRRSKGNMVGAGDYIQDLPLNYEGHVFGTGINADRYYTLPNARIHALRGHLTAERLGVSPPLVGDPGLLLADYTHTDGVQFEWGVIPSRSDPSLAHHMRDNYHRARLIDLTSEAHASAYYISQCEKVVTSSLYGLIVADALGIPRVWQPPSKNANFRAQDYASAFDGSVVPGELSTPPPEAIDTLKQDLRESLDNLVLNELGWAKRPLRQLQQLTV